MSHFMGLIIDVALPPLFFQTAKTVVEALTSVVQVPIVSVLYSFMFSQTLV